MLRVWRVRVWMVLFVTAVLVLAGPARAAGAARGGLVEDLRYGLAVKAAQERRWEKARALFGSLVKAYPQDTRAQVELAQVELEMGHADRAEKLALALLERDPADHFAKEILARARRKPVTPEAPLTFGDATASGTKWERGDEFHMGVPVLTKAGALSIGEPRLVEGPAPTPLEPPPTVKYKLRFEVPGGPAGETALDPAPGPTALVERPGKDGQLAGELVSLPMGLQMPKEAHVPVYLGGTRLVMLDPAGAKRAERPVTADELARGLLGIARPTKVPGLMMPIGRQAPGPSKLLPLARLSARLRPQYSPAGQPSGMWLRVRLVAELFVYPGLRALPDAEVPRACPYLLWPLDPPADGAAAVDALAQKLAAYLDRPGKATRQAAVAAFKPFGERLDRDLRTALEAYRAAGAAAAAGGAPAAPGAAPAPPAAGASPGAAPASPGATHAAPSPAAASPAAASTAVTTGRVWPAGGAAPAAAVVGGQTIGAAATRELRSLVNLALVSGRVSKLEQDEDAAGAEAKARAAEALLLLSRYRIERK